MPPCRGVERLARVRVFDDGGPGNLHVAVVAGPGCRGVGFDISPADCGRLSAPFVYGFFAVRESVRKSSLRETTLLFLPLSLCWGVPIHAF